MSQRRSWALGALAVALLVALCPRTAQAQDLGTKHQLVLDQLSGFRFSSNPSTPATWSLSYYGPVGVSTTSYSETGYNPTVPSSQTFHTTSFWLAPSADIFVIDHLSVGGLLELSTTSASVDTTANNQTTTLNLPSTTGFTLLPRVGWLFNLGDRFAIWPRLGLGYVLHQENQPAFNGGGFARTTTDGFIVDLDVAFLWRFTDSWFAKVAPELSFVPGGATSEGNVSANASVFQFSGVAGIGVFLNL